MTNQPVIDDFHDENYWLDNMWLCRIRWNENLTFNSVEQGFVFFKTTDRTAREQILKIDDPYEAKAFGRAMAMRPDWDEVKFAVMYELVKRKFLQNRELMSKLIHTGNVVLIEGNTWHDNIWGDCTCGSCRTILGQNWLGKILMSLRAIFQDV